MLIMKIEWADHLAYWFIIKTYRARFYTKACYLSWFELAPTSHTRVGIQFMTPLEGIVFIDFKFTKKIVYLNFSYYV